MKIDAIIGVDPGANGGLAVWRPNHRTEVIKMPKDLTALRDYIEHMKEICTPLVFVEKLSIRPDDVVADGSGVNMSKLYRIQTMMQNFEQLKSVFEISDIPYIMVYPMKWQSALKLRIPKEEKAQRKNRFKEVAGRLYPEVKQTLWSADATLIMHFGRWVLVNDKKWVKENTPAKMKDRLF